MSTYVPYSQSRPKTENLHELRTELTRVKETHGTSSSQALEAFQALTKAAAKSGHPLDQLRTHVADETERFFAHTVPGTDGHVFWSGARMFQTNAKKSRIPRRWWWEHTRRQLSPSVAILVTCGEPNCINPEHHEKEDRSQRNRRYTDEQMLGALQVYAMQHGGKSPSHKGWDSEHRHPSSASYANRFGSWGSALSVAGLSLSPFARTRVTAADCIASLRLARKVCGHWPTCSEFKQRKDVSQALKRAGLPSSNYVIAKRLARLWEDALWKAGKR